MENIKTTELLLDNNKIAIDDICLQKNNLHTNTLVPLIERINKMETRIDEDKRDLQKLYVEMDIIEAAMNKLEIQHENLIETRRELGKSLSIEDKLDVAIRHFLDSSTPHKDSWNFFKEHDMVFTPEINISNRITPVLKLSDYTDTSKLVSIIPLILERIRYEKFEFLSDRNLYLNIVYRDTQSTKYEIKNTINNKVYSSSTDLSSVLVELKEMCGFK